MALREIAAKYEDMKEVAGIQYEALLAIKTHMVGYESAMDICRIVAEIEEKVKKLNK